jgi:hypothetical protein
MGCTMHCCSDPPSAFEGWTYLWGAGRGASFADATVTWSSCMAGATSVSQTPPLCILGAPSPPCTSVGLPVSPTDGMCGAFGRSISLTFGWNGGTGGTGLSGSRGTGGTQQGGNSSGRQGGSASGSGGGTGNSGGVAPSLPPIALLPIPQIVPPTTAGGGEGGGQGTAQGGGTGGGGGSPGQVGSGSSGSGGPGTGGGTGGPTRTATNNPPTTTWGGNKPSSNPGSCTKYTCSYQDIALPMEPHVVQLDVCVPSGDWSRASCTFQWWTLAHAVNDPSHVDGRDVRNSCQLPTNFGVTDQASFIKYCKSLFRGQVTGPETPHADMASLSPRPDIAAVPPMEQGQPPDVAVAPPPQPSPPDVAVASPNKPPTDATSPNMPPPDVAVASPPTHPPTDVTSPKIPPPDVAVASPPTTPSEPSPTPQANLPGPEPTPGPTSSAAPGPSSSGGSSSPPNIDIYFPPVAHSPPTHNGTPPTTFHKILQVVV